MTGKSIVCLGKQISLEIPEDWNLLPDEMAAEKFPYRTKPQEIYASQDAGQIITFNILEKSLVEKQVYAAIWEMQRLINRMYPESIRDAAKTIRIKAGMAGYFSFLTGGIQYDSGHCMFILPVHEKMMMGSYHFPAEDYKKDMAVFWEMLKSLKVDREIEEGTL